MRRSALLSLPPQLVFFGLVFSLSYLDVYDVDVDKNIVYKVVTVDIIDI
jgi:hypothetical protein